MRCKKCGTSFSEGAFCPECGERFIEEKHMHTDTFEDTEIDASEENLVQNNDNECNEDLSNEVITEAVYRKRQSLRQDEIRKKKGAAVLRGDLQAAIVLALIILTIIVLFLTRGFRAKTLELCSVSSIENFVNEGNTYVCHDATDSYIFANVSDMTEEQLDIVFLELTDGYFDIPYDSSYMKVGLDYTDFDCVVRINANNSFTLTAPNGDSYNFKLSTREDVTIFEEYYSSTYLDNTFDEENYDTSSELVDSENNVEEVMTFEVTFIDSITNEVISEEIVQEGASANPPDAPVHEGYIFNKWDGIYDNVKKNETVYAVYEEIIIGIVEGEYTCQKNKGDYTYGCRIVIQNDSTQDDKWFIKAYAYSGSIFEGTTDKNADHISVNSVYLGQEDYCLDIYKSDDGGIDVTCSNVPTAGAMDGFYDCSGHYDLQR